jgi:hypothetical protein
LCDQDYRLRQILTNCQLLDKILQAAENDELITKRIIDFEDNFTLDLDLSIPEGNKVKSNANFFINLVDDHDPIPCPDLSMTDKIPKV